MGKVTPEVNPVSSLLGVFESMIADEVTDWHKDGDEEHCEYWDNLQKQFDELKPLLLAAPRLKLACERLIEAYEEQDVEAYNAAIGHLQKTGLWASLQKVEV